MKMKNSQHEETEEIILSKLEQERKMAEDLAIMLKK